MRKVTTIYGDTVDQLAWREYGYRPGAVEAVFEANPTLCELEPLLPAGHIVTMPDLPADTGQKPQLIGLY